MTTQKLLTFALMLAGGVSSVDLRVNPVGKVSSPQVAALPDNPSAHSTLTTSSVMNWVRHFNERLADLKVDQSLYEARQWKSKGTSSEVDLLRLEKALGFNVPTSLRAFYLSHGAFASEWFGDERETVDVFTPDEIGEMGVGLAKAINLHWGVRPEIQEDLDSGTIERLNGMTTVFGIRHIDSNQCVYYYFNRKGDIGSLYLDQDDMEWTLQEMVRISHDAPSSLELLEQLLSSETEAMLEVE
ncbi:MAG: SMI1/KNR4 family protein [Verrucomicrobiaceae bacterium]|nr:SMI1/KNR4 family protein [Verrucomicrobiaceae bacterium]